ncbi:MAG TPA: hypothetical protein VLL75_09060 [Vicinamibacteria bacterium]|nr:hypothetical protein [Vicinamibacteria bacterium]
MALTPGARARLVLALVTVALAAATAGLDLPRASKGEFWGDGATYYAMAWSLARDLDLRFDAGDLARVRAEYPSGPQGLFLKRASGGLTIDAAAGFPWVRRVRADEGRLYYAKAFAHPLVAAPLVALLGTRGLTLANGLLLAASLWLSFFTLRRRRIGPWGALTASAGLLLLTVTPVYLVWPGPEILGLTLITAALAAWVAGRPLLAAVLFGIAGYVKPPNVLMAAPLGIEPLLPRGGEPLVGPAFARKLGESLRRGAVLAVATAGLYGLNALGTGEPNYQGGQRKTFYGRFPLDAAGSTFDDSGAWMTTNQLGPLVAGRDDDSVTAQSGPARNPAEIRESFAWNLGYFWVGRFGGALAYFFPAVAALALFLVGGRRDRGGWLALFSIVLSWLAYIWIIPDNWYGGGGTVGNRYFLNLLPAFLFLVPARRAPWIGGGAVLAAAFFLAPVLLSPVRHSLRPGEHATRAVFKVLPPELTMLNDLAVFTEPWRKKRPFGFVGNTQHHADTDAYFLYFLDDGTFGKEEWAGRAGFWMRSGASAEVVLRAFDLAPVERVVLRVAGGPLGDTLTARLGWRSGRAAVGPGQVAEIQLLAGRGLRYYDTYLHVLHLASRRGAPLADGRPVGAFVDVRLVMGPAFAAR